MHSNSFFRSFLSSVFHRATATHQTTPPKYVQDNLLLAPVRSFEAYFSATDKEPPCLIPLVTARQSRKPSSKARAGYSIVTVLNVSPSSRSWRVRALLTAASKIGRASCRG